MFLMENCSLHCEDVFNPGEQIKIYTSPSNCTGLHQFMNMGVEGTSKTKYQGLMLRLNLKEIETRQLRHDRYESVQRELRRLDERYDPHMLDVGELVAES